MTGQTIRTVENLSGDDWKILSQATERLERSWQANASGGEPNLILFLSGVSDFALRRRILMELVKIDQEYRWGRGQKKLLEHYLKEWPELEADTQALHELLEAECLTRAGLNELPTEDELRRRLPAIGESVDLEALSAQVDCENLPLSQVVPKLAALKSVGRYQILSEIGSGGMGTVFRAIDPNLDRPVALKIPHIDPKRESEMAAQFQQEARAAAKIKHPNICVIHDVGTADRKPYLVMDFISGQSLEDRLSHGPLAPKEAVAIVSKLADALHCFHQEGLIHRDVKPSNVMLKDNGEPVLTDFGLVQQTYPEAGTTIPESLRGTPAYIAPEILNNKDQPPDARSDVYSLGVLLYHCLAGCPPFQGELTEVLRDVAEGEPPSLRQVCPFIDPGLEIICERAMAKSPGSRFQSAADLAFSLKLWCERPASSRLQLALAIVCGLGFLGATGALIWVLSNPPGTHDGSALDPMAQTVPQTQPQSIAPTEEHLEPKRHVAGAPVPHPGKSEPGGEFENAWVLPLDEKNSGQFSDKIDPASDRDTYFIEAQEPGWIEIFVQPEAPLKVSVTLFDTAQDENLDGKPDNVNTSQSFDGHDYCLMAKEVAMGQRLFLRVESQVARSNGSYKVQVKPLAVGTHVKPGRDIAYKTTEGPPIKSHVLKELQERFAEAPPNNGSVRDAEELRRRLIYLCQIHRGRPEIRQLGRWLNQLPWPEWDEGDLKWIDLTSPGNISKRLTIPPRGTLIIRNRTTEKDMSWLHVVEGWQPGALAFQLIPLEEGVGGYCEVNWGQGSDSFSVSTQPVNSTYYEIFGSAPSNLVNLRVELKRHKDSKVGEYVLLLWQPEDNSHSQAPNKPEE